MAPVERLGGKRAATEPWYGSNLADSLCCGWFGLPGPACRPLFPYRVKANNAIAATTSKSRNRQPQLR
jgi:hypothetical protein